MAAKGRNTLSLLRSASSERGERSFQLLLISFFLVSLLIVNAPASPIQRVEGVITKVGEGYLLVKPTGESSERRFILRWTARFTPPKVPLKGDRVLILYKDKEDGAVIYGVSYVMQQSENAPLQSGSVAGENKP